VSSSSGTNRKSSWLIESKLNPQAKLRLFCFPYAGGGSLIFRAWPNALPSSVAVYPVQLPGRENRLHDPLFTDLPSLVGSAATALLPHFKPPFALLGFSMGALIAFELARLLRREHGLEPSHLFVGGHTAPQVPFDKTVSYNLPDPEFLEHVRELNGTPQAILEHAELMRLMLPILRADFKVAQTYAYVPDAPLDCPITAYGGLQDPEATRQDLEAWREQTTASFSVKMFQGDHFFLHSAETLFLQTLSRQLLQLAADDSSTRSGARP